jgi:alpha-beta hydrolase superfamily lysophospholipase
MIKEDLTIQTDGGELAATLYTPGAGGKPGTVILCHGFCGIQTVLLPAFAEFFARNGFRALTFDYRGFGASGGEKGRLVPAMQIDDIDATVRWVAGHAFHENGPIALWGTSLGGAHVVEVAARNELVSCVISQMPFGDGMSMITRDMSNEERDNLIQTLEKMQVRKQTTGKEVMVSVNKVLTDPDSIAFFEQVRVTHPEIDIKIPFLTVRETLLYSPVKAAPQVRAPVMVMAAENDIVNPPEQARLLFDSLTCPKAWHIQSGARHYDLYSPPHFDAVASRQLVWLDSNMVT